MILLLTTLTFLITLSIAGILLFAFIGVAGVGIN